ncbi:MAG: choice-of-anchor tandem repeat GloVer-containing protein [Candidatus Sulfotelmatobacter sp.]
MNHLRSLHAASLILALVFYIAAAVTSSAQTFSTLVTFTPPQGEFWPYAPFVQAIDGNFYGVTSGYEGSFFQMTPVGAATPLYSFACGEAVCSEGEVPNGLLVQGPDGNFYGTTQSGGINNPYCASGCGTVFKITPQGTLTSLYSFCSEPNCADGASPGAGLALGSDGNFYGTTELAGANAIEPSAVAGTIFKITPGGLLTTLYSFCAKANCADGQGPQEALVQGKNGDFYGTTSGNYGTIFKLTRSGVFTTLFSFSFSCNSESCPNGLGPNSALVEGAGGNFYGTTFTGGAGSS